MTAIESETATNKGIRAVAWCRCAWHLVQRSPSLWFGMAALYLIGGALLETIPFAGHLVLVLISPMLLAGALYALPTRPTDSAGDAVRLYLCAPAQQLLRAFATEPSTYRTVLMGIVVVGLVVLVAIAQYFVGAHSVTAELAAARHGVAHTATAALRLVAAAILYALLFMALFYAVHRTVYARREPMAAIADSFVACRRNAASLLVLALMFLFPFGLIAGAFQASPWLGYAALAIIGVPTLVLFVLSSYCSYRDVYGEPAAV